MSGGAYRYAASYFHEFADEIEERIARSPTEPWPDARLWSKEGQCWVEGQEAAAVLRAVDPERAWFVRLLRAVARAAHDVEWVDSGDYELGDEVEAIRALRRLTEDGP